MKGNQFLKHYYYVLYNACIHLLLLYGTLMKAVFCMSTFVRKDELKDMRRNLRICLKYDVINKLNFDFTGTD